VYWPALVPASAVEHTVVLPDGSRRSLPVPGGDPVTSAVRKIDPERKAWDDPPPRGPAQREPLGRVCAARSGDKGGNANVGVWTRDERAFRGLRGYLTTGRLAELIPEAAGLPIRRYELPNLHALNFVITGLLGQGVASSARPDPQAKGLGEYLRSRHADIPAELLKGS
jgi:hypothetical protein